MVKTIRLKMMGGLHSRPTVGLISIAQDSKSECYIEKDGTKVKLNSWSNVICLQCKKGDYISLIIDGYDEEETLKKMIDFLDKFKCNRDNWEVEWDVALKRTLGIAGKIISGKANDNDFNKLISILKQGR